jgi:Mg2+-importing ATPase
LPEKFHQKDYSINMSQNNESAEQAYEHFFSKTSEEVLKQLHSSLTGLASDETNKRLHETGLNTLKARQVSWLVILLRQFKSPFIYLLIGASLLACVLGEYIDGIMILFFVGINASLGFFQEYRSEQALKALTQYTTSQAKVMRNGEQILVPVDQLVPGDIVKLQPGDIIPADLRLLEVSNLLLDESILTGESEPAVKSVEALSDSKLPIHKITNIAFSATNVVRGEGVGVIIATGSSTYIGGIAKLTTETPQVSSFEKGMARFSGFVLRLVGITLAAVIFANLMIKGASTNIVELIIFSIALATAVIPEALPVVITFSLSRGASRLAKHKVVVKRLSAIEDLGGIQVLCTDKTGTITENKLTVIDVYGDKHQVLSHANRAISQKNAYKDPFDIALENALDTKSSHSHRISFEIPFDPERKRNSVLVRNDNEPLLIVRGAAESILPFVSSHATSTIKQWIKGQEVSGRRVIVVAHKKVTSIDEYTKKDEESHLTLSGAISFVDPLKKSTHEAIQKAQHLGVAIKIITGDSSIVAGAIAHEVGLIDDVNKVITAQDFFALSESKQEAAADTYSVFARFSPQEKHQLIDVLQRRFEVGFLGEGINDAPALKSANVALVVHGASDIAREAADIILLNSSLNVIINGIQEGREVFANTIKYVKMTLASNFGNFYAVAIASLIINFLPMLPIQILRAT